MNTRQFNNILSHRRDALGASSCARVAHQSGVDLEFLD
jgi:hypothetical protein